jgi:DNA repair protein RadA/Sms
VSSLTGVTLPSTSVFFGEVGLSGAIRPVAHALPRLKEAMKLGFARAITPQETPAQGRGSAQAIEVTACSHISALVAEIAQMRKTTRSRAQGS